MNEPRSVAIIIPAYNEAATIQKISSSCLDYCCDVIVVDDGSIDNTRNEVASLPVCLLCNKQNMGKAFSLWRGMQFALTNGADDIITLDGDGQHDPTEIPRLIEAATQHPDHIVIAARIKNRHKAPPLRRFANGFADFWVSWAAGYKIRDSQSGFRLYPARLIEQLRIDTSRERGFVFESEVLIDSAHLNIKSTNIAINTIYHEEARQSHYKPTLDTLLIVKMIAGKLLNKRMFLSGLFNSLK